MFSFLTVFYEFNAFKLEENSNVRDTFLLHFVMIYYFNVSKI